MDRIRILSFIWLMSLGLWACSQSNLSSGDADASLVPQDTPTLTASVEPKPTQTITFPTVTNTGTPISLPSPTLTPTPLECWSQGGVLEEGSLRRVPLPLPLDYIVYLPPCYDQLPERRFPVLYLIHGQNYNNDQWDRLGADETADALIASGEIPPFIMVFPRDRSWAQPTEDRFGEVLVTSLIPHIDQEYRTLPDRAYRAIGGLSRGAGWAVHLGLKEWELFGAIGANSLPVFWTDTAHVAEWLDAIPKESLPRIYLDIGEKDRPTILQSAIWFENLLTEKNIPHEWHLFSGYHEEAYWESHVEQYLRWYTKGWELETAQDD